MKHDPSLDNRRLGDLAPWLFRYASGIGVAALVLSLLGAVMVDEGIKRFYHAYLVNFCFFLSLSLGALFFVLVQHLSRAGWSVVVRRVAEGVAANTLILVILFVPILLGMAHLYPWTRADLVAHDKLLQWKQPYLNIPFFILRCLFYFAVWGGWSYFLLRRSQEQDATDDPEVNARLSLRMERWSAPGMLLFALTVTFAAFDLLMSRDPHWFSTIYGVYFFAGSILGFIALLPVVFFLIQKSGRLENCVTAEHYHDIGKFMFAFTVFWAYIAFSQFLLIWYAHLPEETGWYHRRMTGQWTGMSLLLLFGHFIIPFMGLISRYPKRRIHLLMPWGIWILTMHWFDLYWLAMPEYGWGVEGAPEGLVGFSFLDLTVFIGLGGIFVAGLVQWLRDSSLVPERDPRIGESLFFENA